MRPVEVGLGLCNFSNLESTFMLQASILILYLNAYFFRSFSSLSVGCLFSVVSMNSFSLLVLVLILLEPVFLSLPFQLLLAIYINQVIAELTQVFLYFMRV